MRAAWLLVLTLALGACASRSQGNLVPVAAHVAGATRVDMLVATTRAPVNQPPGVMFNGERAQGLRFADISVSIPPDAERKIGDVQWPASPPGDPAHDFVTLRAERLDQPAVVALFQQRIRANRRHHALVFVHGYNTTFDEAVYRFAQVVHDAHTDVVPVLFTWPSRGKALAYLYDRESASYSRDALEAMLQALVKDPQVAEISVLAHSMGNWVAVEALRQMSIRNHGLSPKIGNVMLASPDIDFDVFRREVAEIEHGAKPAPITLFVSQDDKALGLSKLIAGDEPRLGAIDPTAAPYRDQLERAHVHVVDLTKVASDDPANHGKFASAEVVRAIGSRLASGQALGEAKADIGDTLGGFALGATQAVGVVAATAISAPFGGGAASAP